MHIVTSTADFLIKNPLAHNRIIIRTLDGAAKYNGSTLGTISYARKFVINPGSMGKTLSPRLPVEWSLDGIGYDTVRKALGGQLLVHAEAACRLSIGDFTMGVLYNASDPVGAHIRL